MVTKKHIKNQSVSFNTRDPDQVELMKHANKRENFSAYVKRLIQRDMEGGSTLQPVMQVAVAERETLEDIEELSVRSTQPTSPTVLKSEKRVEKNMFEGMI